MRGVDDVVMDLRSFQGILDLCDLSLYDRNSTK